jgi:hypothetical protein
MSAHNSKRLFAWIFPLAVVASALVVRSLEASPASSPSATAPAVVMAAASGSEVADPLLQRMIARFAGAAHAQQP